MYSKSKYRKYSVLILKCAYIFICDVVNLLSVGYQPPNWKIGVLRFQFCELTWLPVIQEIETSLHSTRLLLD